MLIARLDEQGRLLKVRRIRRDASDLLLAAYRGDGESVAKALSGGADVNQRDEDTGLCALHIAVGTNNLALARSLIETHKAEFFPDGFGRWPTLIAAECQVDEALSDYIVEQEARFMEQNRSA